MKPIITVENLSKLYRIGAKEQLHKTFREAVTDGLTAPIRNLKLLRKRTRFDPNLLNQSNQQKLSSDTIWALKNVFFEVQPGEAVGIIGRNGAGKTTLLKILSRITEPTTGDINIYGRVSSLLQVGTGFHPELTGRENIYLNGAILGMRKAEIDRKFDEIVAFTEIEKFLDTPVKFYSSGMYVRLAFAVAAHLEPEILLVDEVLAVGDAAFQKKCLGKMGEVTNKGRTVLFVSHNMDAINRLCKRAVLLEEGLLMRDGPALEVTNTYLVGAEGTGGYRNWPQDSQPGTDDLRLTSVRLLKEDGTPISAVNIVEPLRLQIGYYVAKPNLSFRCVAQIHTQGTLAFATIEPTETVRTATGHYYSTVEIPRNLLAEGEHSVTISIFTSKGTKHHYVQVKEALLFQVYDPMSGSSARGDYVQTLRGVVRPLLKWQMTFSGT
jgi:lipopolysaccharide transport system ATP-binding protein